jgi:hypothetical protein
MAYDHYDPLPGTTYESALQSGGAVYVKQGPPAQMVMINPKQLRILGRLPVGEQEIFAVCGAILLDIPLHPLA